MVDYDVAHGFSLQVEDYRNPAGTVHRTVFDTAATNSWAYYAADFNAAGQTTDQTFSNRDGTTVENIFDVARGGALQISALFHADKTVTETIKDTAGAQTWSHEVAQFDSIGFFLFPIVKDAVAAWRRRKGRGSA